MTRRKEGKKERKERNSITAAGLIRHHGPVGDRCPASGKPPKLLNAASPSPACNEDPIPSPCVCPTTSSCAPVSCEPIPTVQVLERITRAARHQCRLKLTTILEATVRENTVDTWNRLFHSPTRCLPMPARSRVRTSVSLASRVKEQVHLEEDPPLRNQGKETRKHPRRRVDPLHGLACQVTRKI